ncbi:PP2C family protein-serine/threonine phosphatase, partial [Candidatus Hakubella thermalkaliphila]
GDGFYTYHAGDSRLYRLRHSGLKQLTKDHSLVQSLIELGQITIEESYAHPQKNVITNCLGGGNSNCEPEVAHNYTAFEGDIFLLCSDGLSDIVDADKIEEILNSERMLREKVNFLIDAANEAGGKDNITAVLIKVEEEK